MKQCGLEREIQKSSVGIPKSNKSRGNIPNQKYPNKNPSMLDPKIINKTSFFVTSKNPTANQLKTSPDLHGLQVLPCVLLQAIHGLLGQLHLHGSARGALGQLLPSNRLAKVANSEWYSKLCSKLCLFTYILL